VPQTEIAKIIGHNNLFGTKVILANNLAPKKPSIKKRMILLQKIDILI